MNRGAAVGLAAITALFLSSCSAFGSVCPAIGYSSTLTIETALPSHDLLLSLCAGADCIPEEGAEGPFLSGDAEAGWTASFFSGDTQVIGYRLTDATGTVLAQGHVEPEWVRVDGTAECGGNTRAALTI
ncbi:hypothetical protein [Microbacterium testaceum]|uniref:hypothetical protein n=1 Tax=Microbacterium testaceum TaxID=2033 RepID=UPI0012480521|nr:hypothetical protein [Microbacterium testaceum]